MYKNRNVGTFPSTEAVLHYTVCTQLSWVAKRVKSWQPRHARVANFPNPAFFNLTVSTDWRLRRRRCCPLVEQSTQSVLDEQGTSEVAREHIPPHPGRPPKSRRVQSPNLFES